MEEADFLFSSSDDGDSEFPMELETSPSMDQHLEADEFHYQILSIDEIVAHQREVITDICNLTTLPSPIVRILLNFCKWNKEQLLDKYYGGNVEDLFKRARIVATSTPSSTNFVQRESNTSIENKTCSICLTSLPADQLIGLLCNHCFCKQCWVEYLTSKILDESNGVSISCAAHGCNILVDDGTVTKLLHDPIVINKYQQLITNSFVSCNKLLRWCPALNCTYAVKVPYTEGNHPIICKCGYKFCFLCGEKWHDPVKCSWLKKWVKKTGDDSETSNWIAANTKECPKCNVTIEKDGGCNHMVCKNLNCKHDFCWVCLGPWERHGSSWYNCNRYDEDDAKAARENQDKMRSTLARYLHFYNRYMNHKQSLILEDNLYAAVKIKMENMQHLMSWIEVQFLQKAVDRLSRCRETLMYTYVFAFYLKRNNQSLIFLDNQRDLEVSTEILSEYLEREITSENVNDIKQKVQDMYRYCENRRKVLLEHVHEGYDKDLWEYCDYI